MRLHCLTARLHAGERWLPVRSATEAAAGALYLTFILPYETLVSRRFPKFGCFAYIFRGMHNNITAMAEWPVRPV
jgi:hypothetical protein